MHTAEVVADLVAEAVVAGGAGLLSHREGEAVGVGEGVGDATTGQTPGDQRRGVSCVPQSNDIIFA